MNLVFNLIDLLLHLHNNGVMYVFIYCRLNSFKILIVNN